MTARVLVAEPSCELDLVRAELAGLDVEVEAADVLAGDDVVGIVAGVGSPLRERDLDALPRLRVVASCSTGTDHIDVDAAERRGIAVSDCGGYCTEEVADSALALLLALVRGTVELDRSVRAGRWDDTAAGELRRVADVRLGLVGFGRIGRAVALRALGLGMAVAACDPFVPAGEIRAAGATPLGLDELLVCSDAVSVHAALTPESVGLIGPSELASMKPGAILVNVTRAGVVDQAALLEALGSGHLAGAALDVLDAEPPGAAPQAPNLIVTPHAAWYSPLAEREATIRAARSVAAVLAEAR